jgi:dipeptidyl aminopeptidase/acylaminoacyl peptidase
VSWSPRGDRIVYDLIGHGTSDLWMQTIPDGQPVRLTATPSIAELNPSWSPKGDEIAFDAWANGRYDLFVVSISTRKVRRVTNDVADDSDPAWSPAGTQLVFTREVGGDFEIYAVGATGKGLRNLTNNQDGLDYSPSWVASAPEIKKPRAVTSAARASVAPPVFGCDDPPISGTSYSDNGTGVPVHPSLYGTAATNYMCGYAGNDIFWAAGATDYITGGEGGDKMHGGTQNDYMKGRPEAKPVKDYAYGEGGSNTAWCGAEDVHDASTVCKY